MPSREFRGLSEIRRKKLKLAVESTCELCREYRPLSLLEIHVIGRGTGHSRSMHTGKDRTFLVVCNTCHSHIHTLPVPVRKLRALVRKRQYHVKRAIRRILGLSLKRYHPPDSQDLARLYEEGFSTGGLTSFRLGG